MSSRALPGQLQEEESLRGSLINKVKRLYVASL